MYETNIWLDTSDKILINKKAQAKHLSMSTFIDIVVKNYYVLAHDGIYNKFIHKGNEQVHVKLKNKDQRKLTPKTITNCIYLYLHNDQIQKPHDQLNIKHINRQIQSQADKTNDNNYLMNIVIRATYHLQKKA